MKRERLKFGLMALVLSIAIVCAAGVVVFSAINGEGVAEVSGSDTFSLEAPPFIGIADAAEPYGSGGTAAQAGTSYLQEEAGISAYTNVGETINLSDVRAAFRTIEYETDEYIIGSIPLPGYSETDDVHVYVNIDGWVVAYYLATEPTAKIVDWKSYTTAEILTTKLEDCVNIVCVDASVPVPDLINYYQFNYPNATKLMIIADAQWVKGTDTFSIKLPSEFVFYEQSYSHYTDDSAGSSMHIGDVLISNLGECQDYSKMHYGLISPSLLPTDVFTTIKLGHDELIMRDGESFCAIVLIYWES